MILARLLFRRWLGLALLLLAILAAFSVLLHLSSLSAAVGNESAAGVRFVQRWLQAMILAAALVPGAAACWICGRWLADGSLLVAIAAGRRGLRAVLGAGLALSLTAIAATLLLRVGDAWLDTYDRTTLVLNRRVTAPAPAWAAPIAASGDGAATSSRVAPISRVAVREGVSVIDGIGYVSWPLDGGSLVFAVPGQGADAYAIPPEALPRSTANPWFDPLFDRTRTLAGWCAWGMLLLLPGCLTMMGLAVGLLLPPGRALLGVLVLLATAPLVVFAAVQATVAAWTGSLVGGGLGFALVLGLPAGLWAAVWTRGIRV